MASSTVLRTRLNDLDGRRTGCGEPAMRLDSEDFASQPVGELEHDKTSVHEDVVEDMELWRARCDVE